MRKRNVFAGFVLLLLFAICLAGCVNAGEGIGIDPQKYEQFEDAAEIGVGILTALTPFFPWLFPVVAAAGGILATAKTMKPKLTKLQKRQELAHNAAAGLVAGIETLKKTSPESWAKLKDVLKIGPEVENVIRAIRGLPPKI